jgi:DDE superfamily endonuclease
MMMRNVYGIIWQAIQDPHTTIAFIAENGYLLQDCAFENTRGMVTSFEKLTGISLDPNQEGFNTHVGRFRIMSLHTIGMLKGRFQILQSIPMVINNSSNSLRHILRLIDCSIILHNLLINAGDNEIPADWHDDEDVMDVDVGQDVGESNSSNRIDINAPNDAQRQLCYKIYLDTRA